MKKIFLILLALFLCLAAAVIFFVFSGRKDASKTTVEISTNDETDLKKEKEPHPDSLPALMIKEFQGSNLKLGQVLDKNETYTRYAITYASEGLSVSGIMNVPEGAGPFPVLILNHGFIEPKFYTNGQGLKREQDYFARRGYAVLHSDYRNHAQSDFDPANDTRPRTGYTEDVINAIYAVKNSDLKFLDKNKIGMLGHSMGGGIALNVMVVKPELVRAFVLLAPISADYRKNFDRWVAPEMSDIAQKTLEKYGAYVDNPELWESFSAKNYFENISSPVMLHQGTLDKDVPLAWSQELFENLKSAKKDIIYHEYPE